MIRKPEWAAFALSGCCSMSAKPDQHEKQAGQPLAFLGQDQETQKKL